MIMNKSKYINISILLIFIILKSNICSCKTYYVSSFNGSDIYTGNYEYPFKSINIGIQKMNSGDTLFIRSGIYYLSNTIKIKTNSHIYAYNKENIVIHGTSQVQNWSYIEKNIWKATIKDSIIQLFINELPYFQATYPNIPENMDALTKGAFSIAYPTKELFIKGLNQFANVEGAKVLGLHGKGLVSLNGTISKQNGENVLIENNAFYWGEAYRKEYLDTGMAFVIGSKQFLDAEKMVLGKRRAIPNKRNRP